MTADETKHITPDAPRSLSNTPEFPSPEWYAKVRGKKTGRPASEEPEELKEALDVLETLTLRYDAVSGHRFKPRSEIEALGDRKAAARKRVESLFAKQREEIAELTVNFHTTTYANQELTRQLERQRGEAKALQATIDALQTSHAADVRGLKAQLERQRETTLTPVSPTEDFEKMLDAFEDADDLANSSERDTHEWHMAHQARHAARSALLSSYREMKFSPLGDNHHNAALCPHCGEPLRKALAQLASLRLELSEARERQLTAEELRFVQGCIQYPPNISDVSVYKSAREKLAKLRASLPTPTSDVK